MRKTLESYPNLVKEFDFKKNTPLTPKDFSFSSGKKVWWKCSKKHEWISSISNRKNGNNCPYCKGRKVSKENNLKFLFPAVAKEWHPTKNGNLTPEDVTRGSKKKVWWKCSKEHEWIAVIDSRTRGGNCPYCSGHKSSKENNLKIYFPEVVKEWHPTKNGNLTPEDVTKYSNKKIWWKCLKEHEWISTISNRTYGQNCPYCSGRNASKENNLKFLFPEVAKEWHPTKNGNITPEAVTKFSNKKVWWLCPKGHEYNSVIRSRTVFKTRCTYCSGKKPSKENNLKFLFPKVAKEWHPTKNGNLTPEDVTRGSTRKVWWKCLKEHEWKTTVANRTGKNSRNCPRCTNQSSRPEFRILSELERIFKKVNSRYKFEKTEIDIFIEDINVGIEYDGSYYHKDKEVDDKKKSDFLKKNFIPLIRVRHTPLKKINEYDLIVQNKELTKQDLNNILKLIQNFCNEEQKKLINEYLSKEFFTNNENYNKYLTYFPSPIPQNSLTSLNYKFIKEWNYEKNFPLTPDSFTRFSGEKVWWICSKKHEWKTTVANRTGKSSHNCPYCSGQKVSKENNLKFLFPEVAKEWHPIKNGNLTPEDVTKYSNKKVWWKCLKEHEWIAIINLRTRGSKCPKCKKISS